MIAELNTLQEWQSTQKQTILLTSIFYGVHMEGSTLNEDQVMGILAGEEIQVHDLAIQEVKNYKQALDFIQLIVNRVGVGRPYILTLETILELHRLLSYGLLDKDASGNYRLKQVVLRNVHNGTISYTPPPAAEVPYLVEDLVNWINSEESKLLHPVLKAAIIHFELYRIHPFADFNNQVARFVAWLVLYLEGFGINGLLSLDKVFGQDIVNYHLAMQAVANEQVVDIHERDLTPWISYFTDQLSQEFNQFWQLAHKISHQKPPEDQKPELKLTERQLVIIEYLRKHQSMQNKDFRKIFPDYSDDTVLRELKFLKEKGLVEKIGGTKKAVYVLKK